MDTTPVSLLERLRQPAETQAWERFVELYTPVLVAWARHLRLDEADAADLIQEVFLLLVQKLPEFRYDPQRSFRAWLCTVTRNKWRELRRRRTLPQTDEDTLGEVPGREDGDPFWEVEYRRHLAGRALRIMQAEFEPTTWKACWECVARGRPAAEVARELGISVNAVYLAKSRVLGRLHRELDGLLE